MPELPSRSDSGLYEELQEARDHGDWVERENDRLREALDEAVRLAFTHPDDRTGADQEILGRLRVMTKNRGS